MTFENENLRRLVLLLGDVNTADLALSKLRNQVMDNMKDMPDFVREEVPELATTILRINREFCEILKTLISTVRLSD